MPKPFSKQAKQFIANIIKYFESERDNKGPLLPLAAVQERAAKALQISIASVSAVSQVVATGGILTSPKKKRPRRRTVCDLDDNHKMEIRNVLYDMVANKQHVTRLSLLRVLRHKHLFQGSTTSLGIILKEMGFRYSKDDPRRGLMELPRITIMRTHFLRKYMQNLTSDNPSVFVYLDETWIFQNGTTGYSWQDDNAKSVKRTKVDGQRHIILHAGNKNGFIPGAALVFSSKTNTSDYHGEMNEENFLQWFEEKLLKNLEEPSIIIMDNASYHSTLAEKTPTSSWLKKDIQHWLRLHHVAFEENCLKVELLQRVSQNKPDKRYKVDEMAIQYGHEVLRLPPYHCIFNPIEHIWGLTKTYYNKHSGRDGYGMDNALNLWEEALKTITEQTWTNTVRHTETTIKQWWDRELEFDREEIAPLIINIGGDSDSDDEFCSESDESE